MWKGLIAAAMLMVGAETAGAAVVTIDFGTGNDQVYSGSYTEEGFNVTGNIWLINQFPISSSSRSFLLSTYTPTLTISSALGSAFSLVSFDSLCLLVNGVGCPNSIQVQGTKAGGGTTGPVLASSSENWTTANGFASFTNLTSLSITWTGARFNKIDNIVLDTAPPIPLPASAWLLLGAAGGLAAVGRRRKGQSKSVDMMAA